LIAGIREESAITKIFHFILECKKARQNWYSMLYLMYLHPPHSLPKIIKILNEIIFRKRERKI